MAVEVAKLLATVDAKTDGFDRGMDRASSKVQSFGATAARYATMAGAAMVAGLAVGAVAATKVAADFDQQLANIGAVGGPEAVARMDDIKEAALQMGADTAFSASEAAAGMEEMIKAGVSLDAVLGGATQGALDLAAATGTTVPKAATIMSNALNVFGESMAEGNYASQQFTTDLEQAVHVADLFAGAANTSAADVDGLGLALQQVSTVAEAANQDIETTIAFLAAMADAGVQASDAGTSMKTMLTRLQSPLKKEAQLMADYGIEVRDASGNMKDLTDIAQEFADFQESVDVETFDRVMSEIFGSDAIRAGRILTDLGRGGLSDYRDGINEAGAASKAAEQRLDSFWGSVEKLTGSLETLAISVGDLMLPTLRGWVDQATEAVNTFTDAFRAGIASGLNPFHAAGLGLVNAIEQIAGGTTGATEAMRNFMAAVQRGAPIFEGMTETYEAMGDTGLAARIRALGNALYVATGVDLQGVTERLADFTNAVDDFATAVSDGDWDTVGTMISDALGNIGDAVGDAVGEVADWVLTIGAPAAIQWAGDVLGTIGTWISDQLQSLVGEGNEVNIGTVAVAIAGFVWGKVLDLWGWVEDQLLGGGGPANGDPNGIGTNREGSGSIDLGEVAVNIGSFVAENIEAAVSGLWDTIVDAFESPDASSIARAEEAGRVVGEQVSQALIAGVKAVFGGGGAAGSADISPEEYATGLYGGGGMGADLGRQLADSINMADVAESFVSSFEEAFKAEIGKINPIQAVWDWIKQDWAKSPLGNATPNDVFKDDLFVQDAAASELSAESQQQVTELGKQFGSEMAAMMGSQAFTDAVNQGIESAGIEQFAGIGQTFMAKLNEAITLAMQEPMKASGPSNQPVANGAGMATAMLEGIAQSLSTNIDAANPAMFVSVGTALMGKVQESLSAAMSGVQTGPTEAHGANMGAGATQGVGATMVASLATSMAASVTAADPSLFAAVGTAIQAKLSEAITAAMSAGGEAGAPAGGGDAGAGIAESLATSIAAQVEGADFSAVGAAIIAAIGAGLGEATGGLQSAATAVIDAVVASAVQAADQAQEIGAAIITAAGSGMGQETGTMQAALDAVVSAVVASGTATATGTSAPIGAALVTGAAAGIGPATGTFQSAVDAMVEAGIAKGEAYAAGQAERIGRTLAQTAGTGIGAEVAALQSAVTAMVEAGIAAGVAAAAGASAIGSAISTGAAAGVILNALDGPVATMVNNGIAAGMAAAGAASPSKIMMQLGRWMSEGTAIGVAERSGQVSDEVRAMIEAAIAAARGAAEKMADEDVGGFADVTTEPALDIGSQLAQGFWQGLLDEVPNTIGAARWLIERAVAEADGVANKLMARSSGASMLAEYFQKQMADMDPWSDPKRYVRLQMQMQRQLARASSLGSSATNTKQFDVGKELRQARQSGADRDTIRALEIEHDLLGKLADAQHDAFKAPAGSAQAEIAGLRVEYLQTKLEDLGALDIGSGIGDDIAGGMDTASEATETATGEMKRNINSVGGVAERAAEKLGYSFSEAGGVAQAAIEEALSKIGTTLNQGKGIGKDAGESLTGGLESGIAAGVPDVQTMLDEIFAEVGLTATDGGAQTGTSFTGGLKSTLPNAADLAQKIMDDVAGNFEGLGKIGTKSGRELGGGFTDGLGDSNAPKMAERVVNLTTNAIITGGSDAAQAANDAGLDIGNELASGVGRGGLDAIRTSNNVQNRIQNQLTGTFSKVNLGQVNTRGVADSVNSTLKQIGNMSGLTHGKKVGGTLGQGIAEGVRDKIANIKDTVLNSVDSAGNINGSGPGSGIGAAFGQGMANGVDSKGTIINTAVKKAVDKAYQAGMDAANAKSPSKRFAELGGYFSTGMALGIDSEAGAVTGSMAHLVDDAAKEARKFDGSLGPVGFTSDGQYGGTGKQAPTEVHHHHSYNFGDLTFENPEAFEEFFIARAHETAISSSRG